MAADKGAKTSSKKVDKKADKKVDKKAVEKKLVKEVPSKVAAPKPAVAKKGVPVSSKEILAKAKVRNVALTLQSTAHISQGKKPAKEESSDDDSESSDDEKPAPVTSAKAKANGKVIFS